MSELGPFDFYRHDFPSFIRFAFSELYPGKEFVDAWHVEVMADALMRCAPGGERRLMINVPPRHLKSLCASIAWPLFILARHPGLRIFVCAGTRELAAEFNELRERLLKSKRLLRIFPSLKSTPITNGFRFRNGAELVQTVVGRSQIGRGADIIIIDDPISPSRALRRKDCAVVNDWYDAEIVPRLNNKKSAAVIVVMQRLARNDLCGHLLAGSDLWRHISLPAVAGASETWLLEDGTVYRRAEGDVLCAGLEVRKALLERLDQIGGFNFGAQYLQAPFDDGLRDNLRPFRRPTLVPLDWKPGDPTIPMVLFGRIDIADDIRHRYFGGSDPADRTGLREQTEGELEAEFYIQQTSLIASLRADRERHAAGKVHPI